LQDKRKNNNNEHNLSKIFCIFFHNNNTYRLKQISNKNRNTFIQSEDAKPKDNQYSIAKAQVVSVKNNINADNKIYLLYPSILI